MPLGPVEVRVLITLRDLFSVEMVFFAVTAVGLLLVEDGADHVVEFGGQVGGLLPHSGVVLHEVGVHVLVGSGVGFPVLGNGLVLGLESELKVLEGRGVHETL
jgi:hypothetical protein